jgi:hypothetical protein
MAEPEEPDIDQELSDLIENLESAPEQPELAEKSEQPEPVEVPPPTPKLVKAKPPKPKLAPPSAPVPPPNQEVEQEAEVSYVAQPQAPVTNHNKNHLAADSTSNLDKLVNKYHSVFDKLITNLDNDRERIEEFINVYATHVQGTNQKQSFVDGLVQLLVAKAKVSSDGVKLLDTAAKMLAASKSIAIGDKGVKAPKAELDRLMSNDFDAEAP